MASIDIGIDLGKYQLGWADEETMSSSRRKA